MENIIGSTKTTEKERLEIVEKKVEIQRKRLEIKKEKISIGENIDRQRKILDEQRALLEKISELKYLLSEWTVDEERTLMASEPFLTPVLVGKQRELVLNKLMELIKKV